MTAIGSIWMPGNLLAIVVVAFLIRLASVPLVHRVHYTGDEREYVHLGSNVARGGDLVDSNGWRSARSPLFPLLLAGLFILAGESLIIPHIAGCVLGALGVYLGYHASMRIGGNKKAATITAMAMALYPGLIIYSGLLQTETVYIVFFLLTFILAHMVIEKTGALNIAVLGIVCGLAALTRALFLGFFPLLLFSIGWMRWKKGERSLLPVVGIAVVFLVVLSPWAIRNYRVLGEPVLGATGAGRFFLIGNNPYATGTWSVKEGFDGWYRQKAADHGVTNVEALGELESDALSKDIACEYISANPLRALGLAATKAHMFFVYPITHSDSYVPLQALSVVLDFVLLIGTAVGFVAAPGHGRRFMPLYVAALFFASLSVVLHAEARYRLPLVPFLCVFFGWGVAALTDRNRRTEFLAFRNARLVIGGIAILIALVYSYSGLLFLSGRI